MRNPLRFAIPACCAAVLACACATVPPAQKKSAEPEAAASTAASSTASGTVVDASGGETPAPIAWTEDAKAAFDSEVPAIVKKVARKKMEQKARERGLAVIDMAFYEEMKKEQMGG